MKLLIEHPVLGWLVLAQLVLALGAWVYAWRFNRRLLREADELHARIMARQKARL